MDYLPDGTCLCVGCGYFFDMLTGNIVDVKLSDIDAELALEVLDIRKQPQCFCHVRKCAKVTRIKGKGFGKLGK